MGSAHKDDVSRWEPGEGGVVEADAQGDAWLEAGRVTGGGGEEEGADHVGVGDNVCKEGEWEDKEKYKRVSE